MAFTTYLDEAGTHMSTSQDKIRQNREQWIKDWTSTVLG